MKKFWPIAILAAILLMVKVVMSEDSSAQTTTQQTPPGTPLIVDAQATVTQIDRIGVNLGQWTSWGSQQFMQNILMNPGFEGQIDRLVIFVSQSDAESFSDEQGWGNTDEVWNGATYEVRTGASAGAKGTVTRSLKSGAGGYPQYFTDGTPPTLAPKDVIILTKTSSANPVAQWWIPDNSKELVKVAPSEKRPESKGTQSISLDATNTAAELDSYIDAIGSRAGKMLLVNGPWKFSVWAKGSTPESTLRVAFQRLNGSAPFLSDTIHPTTDWQQYTFDFNGDDSGNWELLKLSLIAEGGEIWLDDIALGPVQNGNSAFRQEVIDVLKDLRPSFIRELAPLADTFENRIADPSARRSWAFRLAGNDVGELVYSYSLPEFLDLCQLVGANPWLIVPPTFSDKEFTDFGTYLAQHANKERFSQVIVEFGNENWNWMFRPLGFPYYEQHGLVADKGFQLMTAAAGSNVGLRTVVNGQAVSPWVSNQFLIHTPSANTIAIAPYFFYELNSGTPQSEILQAVFADDGGLMAETNAEAKNSNKNMAVYEVNLHTTEGNAPSAERDPVDAGAVAGTALAKRILESMLAGANPVMIYNLSQYDSNAWTIQDFVKLWGITRDFGVTKRLRPQALIMKMLNQVVAGDLYKVNPVNEATDETNNLLVVAFKTPNNGWTAAAVSKHDKPITLALQFPDDSLALPSTLQVLEFNDVFDTNETEEKVKIGSKTATITERIVSFTIPARSVAVLGSVIPPVVNPSLPPVQTETALPPAPEPSQPTEPTETIIPGTTPVPVEPTSPTEPTSPIETTAPIETTSPTETTSPVPPDTTTPPDETINEPTSPTVPTTSPTTPDLRERDRDRHRERIRSEYRDKMRQLRDEFYKQLQDLESQG